MRTSIRTLLLNLATTFAVAMTAGIALAPSPALAAPAVVTGNANVRSGPGTSFEVVSSVRAGDAVDVGQCQRGFCYVTRPGPDGWVSSGLLAQGGVTLNTPGFGITVGPGGVRVGVGQPDVVVEEPDDEEVAEVCFYDRTRFRGDSFCVEEGERIRDLADWEDRISSISNPEGLDVRVCARTNLRGCRVYATNARTLGELDDEISSLSVD